MKLLSKLEVFTNNFHKSVVKVLQIKQLMTLTTIYFVRSL